MLLQWARVLKWMGLWYSKTNSDARDRVRDGNSYNWTCEQPHNIENKFGPSSKNSKTILYKIIQLDECEPRRLQLKFLLGTCKIYLVFWSQNHPARPRGGITQGILARWQPNLLKPIEHTSQISVKLYKKYFSVQNCGFQPFNSQGCIFFRKVQ